MGKENNQTPVMSIGTSFLMVVFLVLALATFAVLSLSGAKSDYELSRKLADHKIAYYAASTQAERVLDEIDRQLAQGEVPSPEILDIPVASDGGRLSYQVAIDDGQALDVSITLTDPASTGGYYTISAWQVVQTGAWQGSSGAGLMQFQ